MTESERINFFAGSLDALFTVVCTLIESHPEREELPQALKTMFQARQAKHEAQSKPAPVPEPMLDGFQDMRNRVLSFLERDPGTR